MTKIVVPSDCVLYVGIMSSQYILGFKLKNTKNSTSCSNNCAAFRQTKQQIMMIITIAMEKQNWKNKGNVSVVSCYQTI